METIKKVKVNQMQNTDYRGNTRSVPNQFEIETPEGTYFQSYQSIIAFRPSGFGAGQVTILDENKWDYSKTTGRYRNAFLGDSGIAETRKKIKEGIYLLADLNG